MHRLSVFTFPLLFSTACAQAAAEGTGFPGARVLELLPSAGIVGDGATPATLALLALNADGSPITGLQMKSTVNTGSLGPLTEVGGGVYTMEYNPPKVDTAIGALLTMKGKIGKENVSGSWDFPVVPSRTHSFGATANPPRLTLGVDKTASITVRFNTGTRVPHGADVVRVRASVGKVENLIDLGGGQVSALYTVPTQTWPQVAILTVSDLHDPSKALSSVAIPMAARTEVPVVGAPKSQVLLKIGDQQFGPVPTDSKGRAKVPVLLQPGAKLAEQISVDATGQSVSQPLDLKLVETPRIALFPTAESIPADPRRSVDISAAVVTNDGRPDTAAAVTFSAPSGSFGPTRSAGNGIYTAAYTPAAGAGAGTVKLTAAISGQAAQVATADLALVGEPPRLELVPAPATLAPGATSLGLTVNVSGASGLPLPGRPPVLVANGAKLAADLKDTGKGAYTGTLTTGPRGPVELSATGTLQATKNPLWRVLVIPARPRIPNDGLSSDRLTIATIDEFGYPVAGVPVEISVVRGDGSVPATATTNASGFAQVYYTAGRATDLVLFRVMARDEVGVGAIFQAPEEVVLPALPFAGVREEARLVDEWRKSFAELLVPRG